jgi:hypothetical protein
LSGQIKQTVARFGYVFVLGPLSELSR